MSLEEIAISCDYHDMPPAVDSWIREAHSRMDDFYSAGLGKRYPKYIPSDTEMVYSAISTLIGSGILEGNVFCEWGSGLGVATGIASLLGMEAYGIEIEELLATQSRELAKDLEVPLTILQTSYLPEGFEECEGVGGKDLILPEARTTRGGVVYPPEYEGLDPAEVDLFFVYPWPDQEEMMMDLFEAVASPFAVLLMYRSDGDLAAYRTDERSDIDEIIGQIGANSFLETPGPSGNHDE